jgi:hypothetical protein
VRRRGIAAHCIHAACDAGRSKHGLGRSKHGLGRPTHDLRRPQHNSVTPPCTAKNIEHVLFWWRCNAIHTPPGGAWRSQCDGPGFKHDGPGL